MKEQLFKLRHLAKKGIPIETSYITEILSCEGDKIFHRMARKLIGKSIFRKDKIEGSDLQILILYIDQLLLLLDTYS